MVFPHVKAPTRQGCLSLPVSEQHIIGGKTTSSAVHDSGELQGEKCQDPQTTHLSAAARG